VRTLIALAAAGALAGPPAALASTRQVQIPGRQFAPAQAVAIAGDSVTWTNRDFSTHNVTADTFSSGPLGRGEAFTQAFPVVGAFPYRCSIHFGMSGRVDVYHAYLAPPAGSVLFGRTVILHGLAPEGSEVTIERVSDGAAVASATAGAEGRFSVSYEAAGPSVTLRAATAGGTSPDVRLAVRPKLAIAARRAGGKHVVTVTATPKQAGATVAVERATGVGWKRLARGPLSSSSKATLRISVTGTARIRARITRPVGGYAPGLSATIRVRD